MRIIDGLLAELEQEAATTRRVLEPIPEAHLEWRPHPKSSSLGQLAFHVATVPGRVAELLADGMVSGDKAPHDMLSERELQVFLRLARGETVGQIAESMFLSVKTVSTYRARLMRKLDARSNSDLTYYALKHRLLD